MFQRGVKADVALLYSHKVKSSVDWDGFALGRETALKSWVQIEMSKHVRTAGLGCSSVLVCAASSARRAG